MAGKNFDGKRIWNRKNYVKNSCDRSLTLTVCNREFTSHVPPDSFSDSSKMYTDLNLRLENNYVKGRFAKEPYLRSLWYPL